MAVKKSSENSFLSLGGVQLSYKKTVSLMLVLGIALFGASGYVYYKQVFADPESVITGMLNKSLQTNSIIRNVDQTSQQSSVGQKFLLSFSPTTVANSVVSLKEADQSGKITAITSETIGVKGKDYVRYISIDVPNTSQKQDFKSAINVWGARGGDANGSAEAASFLNESLFSVVPYGNLSTPQKNELIDYIMQNKLYEYKQAQVKFESGRPVMVYQLQMSPESLVKVLAKYVTITGVGDKSQLDPEAYKGSDSINLEMKVDLLSRHVRSVAFLDSARKETFGGYGIQHNVVVPTKTLSVDELQSRLSTP